MSSFYAECHMVIIDGNSLTGTIHESIGELNQMKTINLCKLRALINVTLFHASDVPNASHFLE